MSFNVSIDLTVTVSGSHVEILQPALQSVMQTGVGISLNMREAVLLLNILPEAISKLEREP